MASMWRRAMHYLGLGPDEDYDDYDLLGAADQEQLQREPSHDLRRRPAVSPRDQEPGSTVRTLSSAAPRPSVSNDPSSRQASGASTSNGQVRRPSSSSEPQQPRSAGPRRPAIVRPLAVPPSAKPHVVAPAAFTDAQEVADQYKCNVPVIVNLQGVERDLKRRIIDFASGLCYGLGGQMERVADHVYLLTPSDVEVSPEERRRLHERGYEA